MDTGKMAWKADTEQPLMGGVLATAGNLVFTGEGNGMFNAYDARNGKKLWSFNCGAGVNAPPVSYTVNGKQYIAVVSGRTQSIPAFLGALGEKMVAASPEGGTLFVFSLN
jgi:alcohol dehydrogenase (cytochrome c)